MRPLLGGGLGVVFLLVCTVLFIGGIATLALLIVAIVRWRRRAHERWLEDIRRQRAQREREIEEAAAAAAARRAAFVERWGEEVTCVVMRGAFCLDMPEDALLESLGHPVDTDEKVGKGKRTETWKYFPTGKNRFLLRLTLVNGVVTGWEDKR